MFEDIDGKEKLQRHFRIKKVAELLDISEKTLRRMINEGEILAHRIRGRILIPRSEILKIVEAAKVEAAKVVEHDKRKS